MTDFLPISREVLFAALAMAVSLIRYGTYLYSIYQKRTRPHVFSWLNWGLLVGIGAYAQFSLHGGASAWVLVVVSATCLFISGLALFVGEKNITRSDWVSFLGALAAIPIWLAAENPLFAIAVIIVIDALTYYPTIRKSWKDPWGEPPVSYFWAGSRYFFTLFAIPEFSPSVLVYPFFLMASDWGFALYILWRRKVIPRAL